MKKLLIINTHLKSGGGVTSALINLLNELSKLNLYEIDLLVFSSNGYCKSEISETINIVKSPFWLDIWYSVREDYRNISLKKLLWFALHLIGKIISSDKIVNYLIKKAKKIKGYDVVIAFSNDIYSVNTNLGCNDFAIKAVDAKKKIAWIHNDSYRLGFNYDNCKKAYANFDFIVNVSYACKKMFDEIIPEYKDKSKVVYNMFNIKRIRLLEDKKNPYDREKFNIVTVARLDNKQKRIDKIIYCCEKLKSDGLTNFKWHVVGDGPDRDWLVSLSYEKGTNDVITFEGGKNNPYPHMKYADIFVLTSDYEAYAMVMTESLLTGTPVITTNFPAASEVISDNKNGIISLMDEKSIYDAVKKVIQNPDLIEKMEKYIASNKISNELALQQFKEILGR